MKQPAKPAEQPKALAILVSIVDLAITFRFPERAPSLSDVARLVGASSRVSYTSEI